MSHINDLLVLIKGFRQVVEASIKLQQENARLIWNNSSIRPALQSCPSNVLKNVKPNPDMAKDLFERALVIAQGFRHYALMHNPNFYNSKNTPTMDAKLQEELDQLNKEFDKTFESLKKTQRYITSTMVVPSLDNIDEPLEKIKAQAEKLKSKHVRTIESGQTRFDDSGRTAHSINLQNSDITKALQENTVNNTVIDVESKSILEDSNKFSAETITTSRTSGVAKPVVKKKIKVALSENSKARVVPSSRIGRMISFGSLAAGLGVGTVAQYARNTLQSVTGRVEDTNTFMSPANAERIVDTLCKVRGAALKLGQLLSLQDETVISPELQQIFDRVRQSADFMPTWQVENVMKSQLGPEWRSKMQHFEDQPFAAASIGQVHLAVLHNGQEVAIKVQYPGVAKGIDSDIDNLFGVLNVWNVFPKGMFIDNIVEVAKKELSWEVDYVREAECTRRFKRLLAPYPEYFVPAVIDELCAAEVITTELVDATPIDKLFDAEYEVRYDIAHKIMQLCLREMFVLRCMQTDPNWANFFYNVADKKLVLLDFGATREYSKQFMDQYIEIIKAASDGDRGGILRMSREMKFLTGYETKIMEETHVDTVMIMGEVFTKEGAGEFDFSTQKTTKRIQSLVPTILTHRLCPPPEEIYSLHRKLSGVFLLCSKLKVKMNCRNMFQEIYNQYKANR